MASMNPGDVLTATGGFGTQIGQLLVQGSAGYSIETVTTANDRPFYRSGDRIFATGVLGYAWTDRLSSRLTASFTHTKRHDVLAGAPPVLATEAFNSNSNVTSLKLETTYVEGQWSLGPTAGFVYRDRNAWSSTSFSFLPAKTSWSAGGFGRFALTPHASVTARVERVWIREDENPDKIVFSPPPLPGSGTPVIRTDVWVASLGGTIRF
jgi:hypothetical protein